MVPPRNMLKSPVVPVAGTTGDDHFLRFTKYVLLFERSGEIL
jgi:hypothetical protein